MLSAILIVGREDDSQVIALVAELKRQYDVKVARSFSDACLLVQLLKWRLRMLIVTDHGHEGSLTEASLLDFLHWLHQPNGWVKDTLGVSNKEDIRTAMTGRVTDLAHWNQLNLAASELLTQR